jgi:hypothetical protein
MGKARKGIKPWFSGSDLRFLFLENAILVLVFASYLVLSELFHPFALLLAIPMLFGSIYGALTIAGKMGWVGLSAEKLVTLPAAATDVYAGLIDAIQSLNGTIERTDPHLRTLVATVGRWLYRKRFQMEVSEEARTATVVRILAEMPYATDAWEKELDGALVSLERRLRSTLGIPMLVGNQINVAYDNSQIAEDGRPYMKTCSSCQRWIPLAAETCYACDAKQHDVFH